MPLATFHTSRERRWRPTRKKRRAGHTLTIDQENMLFDYLAAAVKYYCRENDIEKLPGKDVELLRKQWTRDALRLYGGQAQGPAPTKSWRELSNDDVDLLKPYLIWKADERNDQKAAAYATAIEDGYRRRLVAKIWENAKLIRMLQWLERSSGDPERNALLNDLLIDAYVTSISGDTRASKNWRELLIPILEEVAITIEERKRKHAKDAQAAGRIIKVAGELVVRGTPKTIAELIGDEIGSLTKVSGVPF